MNLHGIITGDIVASQAIAPKIRQQLFKDTDAFLLQLSNDWIRRYETYRGDSLQCEAIAPAKALRIALMIRCFFKAYIPGKGLAHTTSKARKNASAKGYFTTAFDIRLAVGIGEVDFIEKNKISSSDGQAFRLSGEALDSLKKESSRIAVKTLHESFNEQIEAPVLLLDALMQKWTQNGAEVILYKLQNKKDDEIAALLNISQPAVNQRKKNAQWPAIEKLIEYFEKTVLSWKQ